MDEFKIFLEAVAVVLVSTVGSCAYRDHLVAEMVKAGVDPMKASCAIEPGMQSRGVCEKQ